MEIANSAEILKRYLEAEDFRVSFAHTGDAGEAGLSSFELIVLESCSRQEGFNVLKDISAARRRSKF